MHALNFSLTFILCFADLALIHSAHARGVVHCACSHGGWVNRGGVTWCVHKKKCWGNSCIEKVSSCVLRPTLRQFQWVKEFKRSLLLMDTSRWPRFQRQKGQMWHPKHLSLWPLPSPSVIFQVGFMLSVYQGSTTISRSRPLRVHYTFWLSDWICIMALKCTNLLS